MPFVENVKKSILSNFNLSLISFTIFSVIAIRTALFSAMTAMHYDHSLSSAFKIACILFMIYEIIIEFKHNLALKKDAINGIEYERTYYSVVTAVIVGAFVTFFLHNELGLGPVVASSVVGLTGAMASKRYQIPIYCGSFVGMSSMAIYGNYQNFLFSAILSGILFLISDSVFNGSGGKLGMIALWGTMTYSMTSGSASALESLQSQSINYWIFLYLILGAIASYAIHHESRLNAVESSAVVGLAAGLLLPMIHGDSGTLLASVVFCGSFIGMSSKKRMQNIIMVIAAGAIAALFFIYTQNVFIGLGGKLGTLAFISVFMANGLIKLKYLKIKTSRFTNRQSQPAD